ncbi:SRPBCC family protein [Dehalogenimonas alkenigignens]|uniref:Activator of Hsp90 ATPase 1 family protein n=1 Tax=Dehalogenimonas alkenigignens TaxID=1217799 RepID=A0A0W0GHQ3_9CHLR|nr:SRPBCC family protein [Dehalogenimonas alkenigignens]KTB48103.1 Activator of Hsp90 ATPase 1 family protein [Dehalogenimonas alkenigignens]PVV84354.1 hypothetical protein DD509_03405 [Dehalogenimonas alkenigignens]
MADKTIVQLAVFEAPARRVFEALTDSAQHSAFTGAAASIDARPGGSFSAYDGYISGKFLELEPGARYVQRWRASDWPEGVFSTVSVELGEKRGVSTLRFTQQGVPEAFAEEIAQGWHDFYWDRLRLYLEKPPGR